jgi:EPS-associated MarR family transcriptional regulator
MNETHYRVLKLIEENPHITQRQLANELGVSLGKANYCLKALLEKGWIKANNFKNNKNKIAYAYLLTPSGVEAKARLTLSFLRRKVKEYHSLKREIEELKHDVAKASGSTG